jgi:maleate cis-trans isomerase
MPYVEPVSRTVVKFVRDHGIKVLNAKWLSLGNIDIARVSKETLYHLVWEVNEPESEAIFISCTNLHAVEIIDQIEMDLQKPVVTSNQATMWNMLRMANIKDPIQGFGRLLVDY